MPQPVISVENLSKRYLVGHQVERGGLHSYTALRDVMAREVRKFGRMALDVVRGRQVVQGDTVEEFWALKDVSFEVHEGEVLGIVGRNGAGKSTLLKVLSRITEPTSGRVTLRGRVASLLEVGTGFHPELSGRENIYLNGAILGMSRAEIRKKFDEIVAFAEVDKFLDTPVKRYSSGMYVRLAFAVAAHLEPEILIVDEVLAVGDAEFQKKCLGKMDEVSRREGRTVLFVSHNMAAVLQLTSRAILLSNGRVARTGQSLSVTEAYVTESRNRGIVQFDLTKRRSFSGTREAYITSLWFDRPTPVFEFNEPISCRMQIKAEQRIPKIRASMTVCTSQGVAIIGGIGAEIFGLEADEQREMIVSLSKYRFSPGSYYCNISIGRGNNFTGIVDYDIVTETLFFEVRPEVNESGIVGDWRPGWGAICSDRLSVRWESCNSVVANRMIEEK